MSDSQDIFLLLLVILFMANSDADYQNINSVLLALLLFGTFEARTQAATSGCNSPLNAASYNGANRNACCCGR